MNLTTNVLRGTLSSHGTIGSIAKSTEVRYAGSHDNGAKLMHNCNGGYLQDYLRLGECNTETTIFG